MTQPPSIEAMTRQLRDDIDAVWLRILAEQDELARVWGDLPGPVRVHRLMLMQAHIRDLADSADELAAQWVTTSMHGAYEAGAWATATASATGAAFTAADLDAVTFLAQDLMGDLLAATQGVRESVKTLVRDLTRDWVRNKLYTGMTAEQAGVQLAANLAEHGVAAITYSNGRRVGLSTYTDMAVRTKTAEAYQIGGFNQGDRLGIEWWEVMDGATCGWTSHDDTQQANGMIVDTNTARSYPISHPNCRRSTTPRPDIASKDEARRAKPTSTEAQRADQAQAEANRAAAQARTPRRISLDRQVARQRGVLNLRAGTLSAAQMRHRALTA